MEEINLGSDIKSIQEAFDGINFLNEHKNDIQLKAYNDNGDLGIELRLVDVFGDTHEFCRLDMSEIFKQCRPEHIRKSIYAEALGALSKLLRHFDDNYDENEKTQTEKSYRDFYKTARKIIENATTRLKAIDNITANQYAGLNPDGTIRENIPF